MRTIGLVSSLLAVFLMAQAAAAQECCGTPDNCAHCGCQKACQKKVCQVVCDIKKEKKYCWVVKCEDFCAPLPGCGHDKSCGDPQCGGTCGTCDPACCDPAGCGKACEGKCHKCLVPPKCGKVRTKKTLVKKEYEVQVPVYKCVVNYLCDGCCDGGMIETAPALKTGPAPTPAPKPPAPKSNQQAIDSAPLPPM